MTHAADQLARAATVRITSLADPLDRAAEEEPGRERGDGDQGGPRDRRRVDDRLEDA